MIIDSTTCPKRTYGVNKAKRFLTIYDNTIYISKALMREIGAPKVSFETLDNQLLMRVNNETGLDIASSTKKHFTICNKNACIAILDFMKVKQCRLKATPMGDNYFKLTID